MTCAGSLKSHRKRLGRLLCNKRFDAAAAFGGLATLSGIGHLERFVPILLDQTSLCKDAVQAIVASFVYGNRSIPIDMCMFDNATISPSKNTIEWSFLKRLIDRLKASIEPIFVMDRGYAKLCLIKDLIANNALFIIRGCRNVIVEYGDSTGSHRVALGRLPHQSGKAIRYRNVKYRDDGIQVVDIIVYRERGFQEPWFLIVPPSLEEELPTDSVVQWYRWRMRIEITFRDFKSCLGARKGLLFVKDQAVRMERIMFCLSIAYILLLGISATSMARRVRKRMEMRRHTSRHGTRRTLSVLTVALLAIEELLRTNHQQLATVFCDLCAGWTAGPFSPAFDMID